MVQYEQESWRQKTRVIYEKHHVDFISAQFRTKKSIDDDVERVRQEKRVTSGGRYYD